MEYADVIWDNCTQNDKTELERIQYEAARIVTGCTKLVSIDSLMAEIGWAMLSDRRRKHKLVLFYKVVNGLCPDYLCNMISNPENEALTYNLRNAADILRIPARTSLYYYSFLPSSVREWNSLPENVKQSPTLSEFKRKLDLPDNKSNTLFYYGSRSLQIYHVRLRTNCSSLNADLFRKRLVESPLCPECGVPETPEHYLVYCKKFDQIRVELRNEVCN